MLTFAYFRSILADLVDGKESNRNRNNYWFSELKTILLQPVPVGPEAQKDMHLIKMVVYFFGYSELVFENGSLFY